MSRLIQFFKDLFRGYPVLGASARSSEWPKVEKQFIKDHPKCEVCGKNKNLNVHHIKPFHIDPANELNPDNLITLCRDHHFLFGHFLNWSSWNVDVHNDSNIWYNKIKSRPPQKVVNS